MLHYVHQLFANCVRLPFSAEQVLCSGFLELFDRKQLPAAVKNNAMRVNQNSKAEDRNSI